MLRFALIILFLVSSCTYPASHSDDQVGCKTTRPTKGVVTGYGVKLRKEPGTMAAVVRVINLGAMLTIIDYSGKCETVSGKTGSWLKVVAQQWSYTEGKYTHFMGWVFDPYIAEMTGFERVKEKIVPGEVRDCRQDDCFYYSFSDDGTFTIVHHNTRSDEKTEQKGGYILRNKDVLLLRAPDAALIEDGIGILILRDIKGSVCSINHINEEGLCE